MIVDDGVVHVTTSDGVRYTSKSVVVTSSPNVLKSGLMKFSPPLPESVSAALETTCMNNIVKIILKFSEPCWPSNLHGMICSDKDMLIPEVWSPLPLIILTLILFLFLSLTLTLTPILILILSY